MASRLSNPRFPVNVLLTFLVNLSLLSYYGFSAPKITDRGLGRRRPSRPEVTSLHGVGDLSFLNRLFVDIFRLSISVLKFSHYFSSAGKSN